MMVAHPCLDCSRLITSGARCTDHARIYEQHRRPDRHARGYGADWPILRRQVLARDNGACMIAAPGCTGIATSVDHIIPLSQGGHTALSNLQAACQSCNSGKRDR